MSTSVILVVTGVVCLVVWGLAFYKLMPREGKPQSRWVGTDAAATSVAMGMLVLLIAGVSMVIKGFTV